jgi:hypothetical protein
MKTWNGRRLVLHLRDFLSESHASDEVVDTLLNWQIRIEVSLLLWRSLCERRPHGNEEGENNRISLVTNRTKVHQALSGFRASKQSRMAKKDSVGR